MQMYFSPSKAGFYCVEVHGDAIPEDSKPVEWETYLLLLNQRLMADANGDPVPYKEAAYTGEALRKKLLQDAAAKRWEIMSGGITLSNGMHIDTTDDSLNRITQTVANAAAGGFTDDSIVSFKALNGFVDITIGDIRAIGGLIGRFMQLCFAAEKYHTEHIAATPDDQLEFYDVNVNWPTTV